MIKRYSVIILLLFLILSGGYAQSTYYYENLNRYQERNKRLIEIYSYLDRKKFCDVLPLLEKYIKKYPRDDHAIYIYGLANFFLNDIYNTRVQFKKIAHFPKYNDNPFFHFILDPQKTSKLFHESYIDDTILDPKRNYKPFLSKCDTLRGSLSKERTCYDVFYYDLNLYIFSSDSSIQGSNRIHYSVIDTTNILQIDLFENFDIQSITWNNNKLTYERVCNAVFVHFPMFLYPKEEHSIEITYSGKPKIAPRPPWNGGFVWKQNKRKDWIGVACERLGASVWWPNKDHLSDKADSMSLTFTIPKGLSVVSNGNLRKTTHLENTTCFEWFVSYPINNYNATFYIGNFVSFSDTVYSTYGKYPINYYVLPHNKRKAKKYYANTVEIFEALEEFFGEYPYLNDGAAMVEAPYRGMEHQSAIAIGEDYKNDYNREFGNDYYCYLVVHESAHEWWGNSITAEDMADAWIHEGFATYTEFMIQERKAGREAYTHAAAATMQNIVNAWPVVGKVGINDNTFISGDIYNKGAITLHNLRCVLDNDSLFFGIIKGFYNKYKYKTVNTDDFINYVHQKTNRELTPFFKTFLYKREPPVLSYHMKKENDSHILTYKWINVDEGFEMPFCIEIAENKYIKLYGTSEMKTHKVEDLSRLHFPTCWNEKKNMPVNSFTYYWISENKTKMDIQYHINGNIKSLGNVFFGEKDSTWFHYYKNSIISKIDNYSHGIKENNQFDFNYYGDTISKSVYKKGQLLSKSKYVKNKIFDTKTIETDSTKKYEYYYSNGNIESKGMCENELKTGEWTLYNKANNMVAKGCFINSKAIDSTWIYYSGNNMTIIVPDTLPVIANDPPEYRYGIRKLFADIINEIPKDKLGLIEKNKTYIRLVISPNGRIHRKSILNATSNELAQEIMKGLENCNDWIPGYKNGIPSYCKIVLPFIFK